MGQFKYNLSLLSCKVGICSHLPFQFPKQTPILSMVLGISVKTVILPNMFRHSEKLNDVHCLVIESVRDLVPDDDADAAVVHRLREVLVVEGRLQDTSREH